MASIDMIVVNYKTYHVLSNFLGSLERFSPAKTDWNLTVIDNEFDRDKLEPIRQRYPQHRYVAVEDNIGYAKACNLGALYGESDYIGIFNSDVEFVDTECIDTCVDFMDAHPDAGVCGPRQYSIRHSRPFKNLTHTGIFGPGSNPKQRAWLARDRGQYRMNEECLMVIGAAMVVRREAWNSIMEDTIFRKHWPDAKGAMPEHPLYYEDTALCYAMPKFGYKVYYIGEAELIHQWHQTINETGDNNNFESSRKLFRNLMDDWGIEHD